MAVTISGGATCSDPKSSTTCTLGAATIDAMLTGGISSGDILIPFVGDNVGASLIDLTWGPFGINDWVSPGDPLSFNASSLVAYVGLASAGSSDLVATWDGSVTAAMGLIAIRGGSANVDQYATPTSGTGTAPSCGPTGTLSQASEVLVAGILTEGPVEDTGGTWGDALTATPETSNKFGTTGGVAGSNRTIRVAAHELSATTAVTASLSGMTSRNWGMLAFTITIPAVGSVSGPSGLGSFGIRIGL